ncbi:MAG: AAA family ATPase [Gammaproteobacteria bacterium]|nr:AAA family ATPase [Gammaproteobacteria bacterium]
MYDKFYLLSAEPFQLTPDPRFVFMHDGYRKAYAYMQHSLERGEGVLAISGHSGTGKTLLLEHFIKDCRKKNVLIAKLVTTQIEGDDLLRMVAYSFGLNVQGLDKATILHRIEQLFAVRGKALLVIDEAQHLSLSAFEEIRMLTNLHVRYRPLLQIFLVGQEPLLEKLCTPQLEQLHQRVTAACPMEPLNLRETCDYVVKRLSLAGWRGDPGFENSLFVLIHRFSQGLPRHINKICTRLLIHGCVEKKHQLTEEDFSVAFQELQDEHLLPLSADTEQQLLFKSPGITEIIGTQGVVSDWMDFFTADEHRFIEQNRLPDFFAEVEIKPKSQSTVVNSYEPPPVTEQKAHVRKRHRLTRLIKDHLADFGISGESIRMWRAKLGTYLHSAKSVLNSLIPHWQQWNRNRLNWLWLTAPAALIGAYAIIPDTGSLPQTRHKRVAAATATILEPSPLPVSYSHSLHGLIKLGKIQHQSESGHRSLLSMRQPDEKATDIDLKMVESENGTAGSANRSGTEQTDTITENLSKAEVASVKQAPQTASESAGSDSGTETGLDNTGGSQPNSPDIQPSAQGLETVITDSAEETVAEDPPELTQDPAIVAVKLPPMTKEVTLFSAEYRSGNESRKAPPLISLPQESNSILDLTAFEREHGAIWSRQSINITESGIHQREPLSLHTVPADPESQISVSALAEIEPLNDQDSGEKKQQDVMPSDGTNPQIEKWLAMADTAYRASRYTLPPEKNAWQYYKNILELEPTNQLALAGLEQLSVRYREMAAKQLDRNEFRQAKSFTQRGLLVSPGNRQLVILLKQIKEKEKKYITALERERVLSQDAKALAEASDRLLKQRQENNQRSKGFFSNWFSYSEPDSRSSKNTFGFIGD